MATTKVRKKTPMRNKTAEWRRQPRMVDPNTGELRRVGRMFRNLRLRMGESKGYPTELVILLMKHAGIETPEFDKRLAAARGAMLASPAVDGNANPVAPVDTAPQGA